MILNSAIDKKYTFNTPITAKTQFKPCIGSNLYAATNWSVSNITVESKVSIETLYWCIIAISY